MVYKFTELSQIVIAIHACERLVVFTKRTLFMNIFDIRAPDHFTLSVYWGNGIIKIELDIELTIKTVLCGTNTLKSTFLGSDHKQEYHEMALLLTNV